MKFHRRLILAGALIVGASVPAIAQVQQGFSPIRDLIAKGKRALNDFEYATADTVWHQLLAQPLSRHQRIDVLQLLALTMYPDDAPFQRPDSAASVIRSLVSMGASRMYQREMTWRGLDSLYASVVAANPNLRAASLNAGDYDAVRDVMTLVTDGYQVTEIADRVSIDCYAFAFDELEESIRRQRAYAGLPGALKAKCSRLFVESDPATGKLTVGGRDFGPVPERGQLRWVQPAQAVELSVSSAQHTSSKTVEFPIGRTLHAKFFLPKDTLLWPAVKTPEQIAEELRLFDRFTPSTPRPQQPVRPRRMGAFATGLLWGLVGGAAGYAVGQFLPAAGCVVNEEVPPGQTFRDPRDGKTYTSGQTINLGGGMPCLATVAGGSFGGMFLFSAVIKGSRNRAATGRYEEAVKEYPSLLSAWEQRERRQFAERNPDVRQRLADERTRLAQVQADNTAIRARNARLPEPVISIRDLDFAPSGATSAPPVSASRMSDVDMRVPEAASPNPNAVAIVIGNRDYQTPGVPNADYAVQDAMSVKRYLVEAFGFSEDRIILDTNVSVGRMNELFGSATDASSGRLAELVASRPAGTVDVVVFYSGHGHPEGRPPRRFLVPVDGNPRRLAATGYPLDALYKNLTALRARSVLLAIDAGFGALSDAGSLLQTESFGGIELEVGTVGGANTQVLHATTGEQTARWRRDQSHGLFTYYFLRGIQGGADTNGDATITAAELETYIRANVRNYAAERMTGAQQVPEIFTNNPSRPIVTLKPGS